MKASHFKQLFADFENLVQECGINGNLADGFRADLNMLNLFHIENIGNLLSIGVFICDKSGIIRYVNSANEKIVGIKAKDCVGHSTEYMVQTYGIKNIAVRTVLTNEQSYSSIVQSPINGTHFLSNGSPIYDLNHNLCGAIVIDQDLTLTNTLTHELNELEVKTIYYKELFDQSSSVINQLNRQDIIAKNRFTKSEPFASPSIIRAYHLAEQAAQTDVTTLLLGETGSGKEVIANYIFEHSDRAKKAYIKVNCASIPENLLESELFGYVKGAFTGANSQGKLGLFELANNGTIFLDEIGDLPYDFQAKLLRAIQQQEITKIGDTKVTKLNLRIIAATNRNLKEMMENGTFRSDLYYRLNIFPIQIPALRERREDIPILTEHFLKIFNRQYKKNISLSTDAIQHLTEYRWPGNIRELENMLERWVVIFENYTHLTWKMVKNYFPDTRQNTDSGYEGRNLKELMNEYEKDILNWAFQKYSSTRAIAAALDVDHSTIVRKAKQYNIRTVRDES